MSAGPGGEHNSDINGSGNPTRKDIMTIAGMFHIVGAEQIVEEVREAVLQWPAMAATYGVSRRQVAETGALIDQMVCRIGAASTRKPLRK